MRDTKIVLSDSEIPSKWYNIMADMPNLPGPPLHPATKQPIGPDDLEAIFPMSLIEQEVSTLNQHPATSPIHDGYEIAESLRHRYIRYICRPDLVRPADLKAPQ